MSHLTRTMKDRDYSEILKRLGPLTNSDLAREAAKHPHFTGMTAYAIEKDVDRFVKHYENLGIVARNNGRIEWLPSPVKAQGQSKEEPTARVAKSSQVSQHEAVTRLIQGMADGSIILREKSPHKELNRVKGEIFDEFMADIDFYNHHGNEGPITWALETRIYNTALKLRAYGFIEKEEQTHSRQSSESSES
jgi:hypothetical protein